MKKLFKGALCAILLTAAILPLGTVAAANSAPAHWEGTTSSGLIVRDENCPIRVESEKLTFDISQLPENYYDESNTDKFNDYPAKVTAEYNLYNPCEYTVDVRLAFPFGRTPEYVSNDIAESAASDISKYNVKVDGNVTQSKLRHTFSPYGEYSERDVKKIKNEFAYDDFYSPDLKVTKYTVKFETAESDLYVKLDYDYSKDSRLFCGYGKEGKITDISQYNINDFQANIYNDYVYEFYIAGKEPADGISFKFYKRSSFSSERVYNVYKKITVSETNFLDFALTYKNEGVSGIDWYNAVIDCLSYNYYGYINVSRSLMRWYEYAISFAPDQRLKNTVTAPIYPAVEGKGKNARYVYDYLLSPAKGWDKFDELEIFINTPYYLNHCTLGEPIKTTEGYKFISYGVPDQNLRIIICESENSFANIAFKTDNGTAIAFYVLLGLSVLVGGGIGLGYGISCAVRKKKRG